jgi:hypothetical protein
MKKLMIAIVAALLAFLVMAPAAFAEGAPPSNAKKGDFISVDAASRTAVFKPIDSDETVVLKLDAEVDPSSIDLNERVMVAIADEDGVAVASDISRMFIGLTVDKLIALLLIGLIGGLLSGFIGSGGAFVLTPAMMSLGAPGAVAVASNMCHKFPKAMVGTYKRYRYGQVDIKLGLILGGSAVIGVELGIRIQKWILDTWGSAASDLYVSFVFVIILLLVGGIVLKDALSGSKKKEDEAKTPKLALAMQKVKIPPMIHFKKAGVVLSVWVTVPVGFGTGLLAATIAVGGFIGVPGMIYVVGASAMVASATELLIAFVMGMVGSVEWAMSGLIDIRLTLLILATSLLGVQLGALGTTYVKDHTIKLVMAAVMLIVSISRGVKIPVYLTQLDIMSVSDSTADLLNMISFGSLIAALLTAALIITSAMIKGIVSAKAEEKNAAAAVVEGA